MNISEILRQVNAFWQKLGGAQKVSIAGFSLMLLMGFAAVSVWASRPSFSILYSNISSEDASSVVSKLEDSGIPYRLSNRGSTVMVPSSEVNSVRLKMAGEGLPKGNYTGFELFDKNIIGLTDFMQKVNYARALQGELARTISEIEEVSSCRVHIVIPEESIFEENQKDTTASIIVKLQPGRFLNKQQVGGIRYLVASAVAGLKPANITIVDTNGTALSQASTDDSMSKLNQEQLDAQKSMDRYLENKVQGLLEGVLGHGNAVVKVTSELNFEKINKTIEKFDPESAVVRKENIQNQKRKEGSSSGGGGNPGAEPNVTTESVTGSGSVRSVNDTQENIQNEYEIDRTVQHVTGEVGNIKRLSIAVYLARRVDAQSGESSARTDKEMTDIENMVKAAVGYRSDPLGGRVDDLVVKETDFDNTQAKEQDQILAKNQRYKLMTEVGRYLMMAVVAGGLVFLAMSALKTLAAPRSSSLAAAHLHSGAPSRKSAADFDALENAVLKDLPELQEGEEGVKQLEQYLSLLAEDRTPDFINLVKSWIQNPNS